MKEYIIDRECLSGPCSMHKVSMWVRGSACSTGGGKVCRLWCSCKAFHASSQNGPVFFMRALREGQSLFTMKWDICNMFLFIRL